MTAYHFLVSLAERCASRGCLDSSDDHAPWAIREMGGPHRIPGLSVVEVGNVRKM